MKVAGLVAAADSNVLAALSGCLVARRRRARFTFLSMNKGQLNMSKVWNEPFKIDAVSLKPSQPEIIVA